MSKSKFTVAEQIANAREEIKQKENRVKKLLLQQKEQDRKARTKRLIERGAILESLIAGAETHTNEEIKTLLQKIFATPYASKMINAFVAENGGENAGNETTEQGNETGRRQYTQTKEGNGGNGKADEGGEETTAGT